MSGMEKNKAEEKSRLEKQIAFLTEVDKEKNIFRQTYLADGKEKRKRRGTCMASGAGCGAAERTYKGRRRSGTGYDNGSDPRSGGN